MMDVTVLRILLIIALLLFVFSLAANIMNLDNPITIGCMLIAATLFWKLGNVYIDGTLTQFVNETTATVVISNGTASGVLRWLGITAFLGFLIQTFRMLTQNYSLESE